MKAWLLSIVRMPHHKFMAYVCLIGGLVILVDIALLEYRPVLSLQELDVRSGILIDAKTVGRYKRPRITLGLPDGKRITYAGVIGKTATLHTLLGKPVKIWSQEEFSIIRFGYREQALQIQYLDTLIVDYEKDIKPNKVRYRQTPKLSWDYWNGGRLIAILLIIPSIIYLWHFKRTKPQG